MKIINEMFCIIFILLSLQNAACALHTQDISVTQAVFQVLNRLMWLAAAVLDVRPSPASCPQGGPVWPFRVMQLRSKAVSPVALNQGALSPRGHLAMPGDSFACHDFGGGI